MCAHRFAQRIGYICLIAVSLLAFGCREQVEPPAPLHIRMAGSTAMQPLLESLTKAYSQHHPHVSFAIEGSSSSLGLEMARQAQVDIGASSWFRQMDAEGGIRGRKLQATTIALDGLAIVVHPSNPVEGLTRREIRDIFYGRILDWWEVEGKVGDILVVSREDGSGSRVAFETIIMDNGKRPVTLTAVVTPGSQDVVEYVTSHPHAIGYVSMGHLSEEVKALEIDGIAPTPQTVGEREYPLVRPLLLLTEEEPSEEIQAFIEFILSPAGQAIVGERYGRVSG
jgi:phosphate transport system substrate-binding protein